VCIFACSFVTNVSLDCRNASVERDGVLLECDPLLHQLVSLLLEEVTLVDVDLLELHVVLLQVRDVLDDLFEDIVRRLSGVVLERCTFRAQQLHFFLVVVEHLGSFFGSALQ
jgi:hypothetical protein